MNQQSMLTALLREEYGSHVLSVRPLHRHTDEDRGVYHVHAVSTPGVLQTVRQVDVTTTLLKQATILDYLARCGYPAPRPIPTLTHKPVSSYQNWSALFTTFIEGMCVDSSYQSLTRLGAALGKLHKQTEQVMMGAVAPLLPSSRFQLASAIPYALGQLLPEAHRIPFEIWPLYHGLIVTLHRIQQTINLPITIIHADLWPHHAICTAGGEIVITSWRYAGVGPAILDVSYLLLTSHLQHPQQTSIRPNERAIAAVVRGYCQQRALTAQERGVLLDAVRFGIAFNGAQSLPSILYSSWRENVHLRTLQSCYDASAEIAALAVRYFEQELAHTS